MSDQDIVTFPIEVEMQRRWIPHFLGMLARMEYLGGIGASRRVSFMSDGDGDFRPVFDWPQGLPEPEACRSEDKDGNQFFDAG